VTPAGSPIPTPSTSNAQMHGSTSRWAGDRTAARALRSQAPRRQSASIGCWIGPPTSGSTRPRTGWPTTGATATCPRSSCAGSPACTSTSRRSPADMPFEGTTAIVTGGAAGLGLAITEAVAARGTKVAIFDINADGMDVQVDGLPRAGANVAGYVVDVSNRGAVESAVAQVRADLGPVLMLVNNAGIEQFGKFAEITDEQWDRVMAVNLRGPYICAQVVLPDMLDAQW